MNLKEKLSKIVPAFAIVIVLVFAISEIYNLSNNALVTQTAYESTVLETVDVQMYIIKDEILLTNDSDGVIVPVAKNSERVSRGSAVAAVFDDEKSAENYAELNNLNIQLESYNKINNSSKLADIDLGKLNSEIDLVFENVINCAYSNDFSSLTDYKMSLSEKLSRKQISLNKKVDVSEHISQVQGQIEAVRSSATPSEIITAETSGYYVNHLDGFENSITSQDIENLTLEKFEEVMNAKPAEIPADSIGKIIDGYNWYVACVVNSADISEFDVGDTIKLMFDEFGDDAFKTKIHLIKAVDENRAIVVFRCNLMNEFLSGLRKVNGKIVIDEHNGLKVNRNALRIDDDGNEGVYVLMSDLVVFRNLNVVYSEDSFVIAKAPVYTDKELKEMTKTEKEEKERYIRDHLKLYDEVIISGKELSDGMYAG